MVGFFKQLAFYLITKYIPDFQVSTHKAALAIDLFKSASYEIYLLPITASQKLAVEETAIGFVT